MTMAYQTQFVERLERTPTAVSYRFKRPPGFDFTAGQYMVVDLGEERIHPLSLSDCPEENRFIEFTKRMTGSPFCQRLEALTTADTITVKGPSGKFCLEGSESEAHLVLLAGGIGITPLRSILKSQEKKRTTAGSIILLYGNKNQEDIAFREELENLQLADYRLVHVLDDPAGVENAYQGFITGEIVAEEVANPTQALYMISGPTAMVEAIKKNLLMINIDEERIRTDIFLGYD